MSEETTATILTASRQRVRGLGNPVYVEETQVTVETMRQLPGLSVVGLAPGQIGDMRERVFGRLHSGRHAETWSKTRVRIIAEFKPSHTCSSEGLDLPLALAILAATGNVKPSAKGKQLRFVGTFKDDTIERPAWAPEDTVTPATLREAVALLESE